MSDMRMTWKRRLDLDRIGLFAVYIMTGLVTLIGVTHIIFREGYPLLIDLGTIFFSLLILAVLIFMELFLKKGE